MSSRKKTLAYRLEYRYWPKTNGLSGLGVEPEEMKLLSKEKDFDTFREEIVALEDCYKLLNAMYMAQRDFNQFFIYTRTGQLLETQWGLHPEGAALWARGEIIASIDLETELKKMWDDADNRFQELLQEVKNIVSSQESNIGLGWIGAVLAVIWKAVDVIFGIQIVSAINDAIRNIEKKGQIVYTLNRLSEEKKITRDEAFKYLDYYKTRYELHKEMSRERVNELELLLSKVDLDDKKDKKGPSKILAVAAGFLAMYLIGG